jgi:hypothetical protein
MISEADTDRHLAEILEILKQKHEDGDKTALLYAVYHCLLMKRPLPEWLRLAFLHTYESRARFEIRSWDEAFGTPVPRGTHLEKEREHTELRARILERARELTAVGATIDKHLFEEIGRGLGISGTTASTLYYDERGRKLREHYEIIDRLCAPEKK